MERLRRTWAEVSLDALAHNYTTIRRQVPGAGFLGVVKADAYGHGAVQVSRTLAELGAEYLAVSNLEEAVQLRRGGVTLPVLLLGYTPPCHAADLADWNVTQEVHSLDYARQLDQALAGSGKSLQVHLKLDTGMTRIGFLAYGGQQPLEDMVRAACLPHLRTEGAFMHFCVSDSKDPADADFTRLQYRRFCDALDFLKASGVEPALRHCCNSGAIAQYPEYAMDLVRSGIITYGLSATRDTRGLLDLRPMLKLQTAVAQIRTIPAGTCVSYGRTYTTSRQQTLAVLPIGYADGLLRSLSNRAQVLLNGRLAPVVGRICMDMCMVDVTDLPQVREGDVATIIGGSLSCEHLADLLDTITYEVVCGIGKRVPRIYTQNGRETGVLQYIV